MKCVSYTRTMPWKNHTGELTIADQNQRIAEYLAEHKEFDLQKKYSDRKGAENASAAFDKMIDDFNRHKITAKKILNAFRLKYKRERNRVNSNRATISSKIR